MTSISFALLLLTLFVAGVVSALTGAGFGTIVLLGQTFFLDIRTNIAITSALLFIVLTSKAAVFYKEADYRIVRWYVLAGLPSTYLGARLLFTLPDGVPEKGLGALCFLFVCSRMLRMKPFLSSSTPMLLLVGALNGFIGGIFGNVGILMTPLIFLMGLKTRTLVATTSVIGLLLEAGKLVVYIPNIEWTPTVRLLLLCAVPVVFLGVTLGKRLLRSVDESLFERLLLGIIAIGAIRLLFFS